MQVRLLRVLETRTYSPLGATGNLEMKARVIVATHRDLKQMVERKQFREDLYFRIVVVRVVLPRLSERKEDIPLLVDHFIDRFNTLTGKSIAGTTQEAMAALVLYDWPGNVRELENAIQHAFVLCRDGLVGTAHLPDHVRPQKVAAGGPAVGSLKDNERQVVLNALIRNQWRSMATARELKIDKNTLRRKIRRFGLRPED